MPEIKQYTRQVNPSGFVRTENTQGAFGGTTGRAMAQAGQQLEDYAIKQAKRDYVAKISQFELDNIKAQEELSKQDFDPDVNIAEVYQQDLEARASQLEISPLVSDQWQQDLGNMRIRFAESGLREDLRREAIKAKEDWANTITNVENAVALGGSREQAMALINEAADALPRMSAEDKSRFINNAKDKVLSSEARRVVSSNPYKFKRLAKDGYFNDLPNLQKFIVSADSQIKQQRASAQSNMEKAKRLARGALDPKSTEDKKAANQFYESFSVGGATISEGLMSLDSNAATAAVQMSSRLNFVPTDLQSDLRALMNATDSESQIYGYQLASNILNTGAKGFSETDREDIIAYSAMVSAGENPKISVENINRTRSPEYAKTVNYNREILNGSGGKKVKIDAEKRIIDNFDTFWSFAPRHVVSSAIVDYEALFKNNFLQYGNERAAHDYASRILSEKYSLSEVGGVRTVTEFSPEDSLPKEIPFKDRTKLIERDLKRSLKQNNYDPDLTKYSLQPKADAEARLTAGLSPRYYVIDVEASDIVRDENNNPLEYEVDYKEAQELLFARDLWKTLETTDRAERQRAINEYELSPDMDYFTLMLLKQSNAAQNFLQEFSPSPKETKVKDPMAPSASDAIAVGIGAAYGSAM